MAGYIWGRSSLNPIQPGQGFVSFPAVEAALLGFPARLGHVQFLPSETKTCEESTLT